MIILKRADDKPSRDDGTRILVSGLWPRGITREKARIHLWLRGVAPSSSLRKWFNQDEDRWTEFKNRYHRELFRKGRGLEVIRDAERRGGAVTLVFGEEDRKRNVAVVLKERIDIERGLT
jgi:uncharacterized protein YeaO (DUF488 family)